MPESVGIIQSLKKPRAYTAKSLIPAIQHFKVFSVASLYTYLDVPFDIVVQFRAEYISSGRSDCEHIQITTELPVLAGLPSNYAYFLEGIPLEVADDFMGYMQNLRFVDKAKGMYSEVIWDTVNINAITTEQLNSPEFTLNYTVFTPNMNTGRTRVNKLTMPPTLVSEPPDAQVLSRYKELCNAP